MSEYEYKLIDTPDIFELKDDFEAGRLYHDGLTEKRLEISNVHHLCHLVSNGASIYRKTSWDEVLDGTKENAVLCRVWDNRSTIYFMFTDIINTHTGSFIDFDGVYWDHAEPVPPEMVAFIKG